MTGRGSNCACSRQESLREPDAGNPHVRFDEGRGASTATSPTLPIASSFDIFRVWFIVVSSLGLSAAAGKKVSTAAIFLTYLGIWVLLVLGKAGWAALMS